jgi:hypothetical protein
MPIIVKNWKGKDIKIVRSRGGVRSVCNYEDNIIIPYKTVWPHPDIVKKLYKSNHEDAFDEKNFSNLGFYCDLQSLRSEDAITWSVFGTLHYFSKEQQVQFVNSLLKIIGVEYHVSDCFIQLWTRIAHPETLVSGGPELDFQTVANNVVVFGEAKWRSKVANNQGKDKNKNQLELREKYFEKFGTKIFPNAPAKIILIVGLDSQLTNCQLGPNCHYVTWKRICEETEHPMKDELGKYYAWKEKYGN